MSYIAHRLLTRLRFASKRRSDKQRTGGLHATEGGKSSLIEQVPEGQRTATWEDRQQHGHNDINEPFFERPSLHFFERPFLHDSAMNDDDEEGAGAEESHPITTRISHRDSLCVQRSVEMRTPKETRKKVARFRWPWIRERIRAPTHSSLD